MLYENNIFILKKVTVCCTLLCLLLSGCAQKRWGDSLSEDENREFETILRTMQQQEQLCFQSFDTDIKMFWQTPTGNNAIEGYLVLSTTSSVKFILSNPLGQPVFAFTGNGETFQMLKANEKKHIRGNVRSLAIRNQIPLILAQGDWFAYLTGRVPLRKLTVEDSGRGSDNNTIWLKLLTAKGPYTTGSIHVQVDPDKKELLSYLFLDDDGDILAEIQYGGGKTGNFPCSVHTEVQVTELPWGSAIRIELENISGFDQFSKADFSLPVPKSFNTQLWP